MREDVLALFHDVADLDSNARATYYSERQVPTQLRDEIESLLRFDAKPGSLTDHIAAAARDMLGSGALIPAGTVCGAYRVVRSLGTGGMGAVYLAERADGEVEQRVAIKFV